MHEVSIIGGDLAKRIFQLHGAAADGKVLFRKRLSRTQFVRFIDCAAPVFDRDGSVRDGTPLGQGVAKARAWRAVDPTDFRQTLRQAAEK